MLIIIQCERYKIAYATWSGTHWMVLAQTRAPAGPTRSPTSRRVRHYLSDSQPSTRPAAVPREPVTMLSPGRAARYGCPDCRRVAAKKCAMEPRRCIHHCVAAHCSASGHGYIVRTPVVSEPDIGLVRFELTATSPSTDEVRSDARIFELQYSITL